MKYSFTLLALFFLLSSHELFLKSDTYFLEENDKVILYLYNGTFDQSENVITRDRITKPRIVGPKYAYLPANTDYYDEGNVTYLKITIGEKGTYAAGISTLPRAIELTAKDFTEYLEHEGLTEVIKRRESQGLSDKPARERYAKHVKAILQVGEKRTKHFKEEFGYPTEFIPLNNPYELKTGDELTFMLKYQGKPLPNQVVHCSSRSSKNDTDGEETMLRTDDKGKVSVRIDRPGYWYVATIKMVESEEEEFDYESNWATLTFEVK